MSSHNRVPEARDTQEHATRDRGLALALLLAALALVACSPEAVRTRGGGPGADLGNRTYPLPALHGDQTRNNPSYQTPQVGLAPREAKGVPGFWVQPELRER